MESVNDVLRVYNAATEKALIDVTDLNTFYGYPAQFNRTTGLQGPFVTDPSCYFDVPTQRWFQVVLTLDVNAETGDFLLVYLATPLERNAIALAYQMGTILLPAAAPVVVWGVVFREFVTRLGGP